MRFLRPVILAITLAMLCATARGGTLHTRDGRVFEGELQLLDGQDSVKIIPKDAVGSGGLVFKISDVASMALRPPLGGVLSGGTLAWDWTIQDIGTVAITGSADYAQAAFTLRGEGTSLGGKEDSLAFTYQPLPSEGQLIAHIDGLAEQDPDAPAAAKAGLMIRQSLEPNSPYAVMMVSAGEGVRFLSKSSSEVSAATVTAGDPINGVKLKPPCWLKIMKIGDVVIGAQSVDGKKWDFVGRFMMRGLRDGYIGMFVSSARAEQLATATVDHVQLTIHGLKGEYFGDTKFKDLRLTRIDAKINFNWIDIPPDQRMPASNYVIRWTGQVEAPSSDTYTFYLWGRTASRLWIGGQMVLDTRQARGNSKPMKLEAGKRYDLRVDYYEGNDKAACQLQWSNTVSDNRDVPTEQLYYAPEAPMLSPTTDPALKVKATPVARGVLLVDGTFLPGAPKSADQKALVLTYRDKKDISLPLDTVARVTFRPSSSAAAKVLPKGPGLLTVTGDFTEGECQDIRGGKIRISSVLFGVSTFDAAVQAAEVVYRDVEPTPSRWVIHTTSGAEMHADSFHSDKGNVVVDEPLIGSFTVGWKEIVDITGSQR